MLGAEEGGEELRLVLERQADPRILHADAHAAILPARCYANAAFGRRIRMSVREQVREDLRDARGVAPDSRQRGGELEGEPLPLRLELRPQQTRHALDQRNEVQRRAL